jgi:hypothetical protein
MRTAYLLPIVLGSLIPPAHLGAQTDSPEHRVEIIGLKSWTRQMVEDSLQRLRPGVSLGDAACAVLLEESLGFARAAVQTWHMPEGTYTTLTVLEPHETDRVDLLTLGDSLPDRPEWREAISIFRSKFSVVHPLQDRAFLLGRTDQAFSRDVDPTAIEFRNHLSTLARTEDFGPLVQTVSTDRNLNNRLIATLLLGHHLDRDEAWHTLLRALRGSSSDIAQEQATAVMKGVFTGPDIVPTVDWSPAADDLRALISGTNLFAFLDVLLLLVLTEADPALVKGLIPLGEDLLIGNLYSVNPARSRMVRYIVGRLSGEDFGDDLKAWEDWVRDLNTRP